MARLYEHQGKELLREAGLQTPRGEVASSGEEARRAALALGGPVVIKSQVWATGRFKAGGIRFADGPAAARKAAEALLGSRIKDFPVEKVLVEERLDIAQEFYAGVIVDASHRVRAPVLMFTTEGGVDVESVDATKIGRLVLDVDSGLSAEKVRVMMEKLDVEESLVAGLSNALVALDSVFRKYDARSAEINPLVATADGRVVAADCRVSIDDSSVSRHPELGIRVARESSSPPTEWDAAAWRIEENDYRGTSYFAKLAADTAGGGYIGYHAISGGGGLLAADVLTRHGLRLANFAETSGNPPATKVYRIAKLVLSQPDIDGYCLMGAVLANQDQSHHARGLVRALREELASAAGFPVVVLLAGNREIEAHAILREGLADLPLALAVYGREHLHRLDAVAARMKELVDRYREAGPPGRGGGPSRAGGAAPEETGSTESYAFRTGRVLVDRPRCAGCTSLACVKACSMYGGYLYRVQEGAMASVVDEENWPRRCTECLACEYECRVRGQGALRIEVPVQPPGAG